MDLDLDPPQPQEIARLVHAEVAGERTRPDPWWQDGIDEALSGGAREGPWAAGQTDARAKPAAPTSGA